MDHMQSDALLIAILQASDFEELRFHAKTALAGLNLDEIMLRTSIVTNDGPEHHMFGTLPPPLLKLFGQQKQLETDPVDLHFSRSGLPLTWSTETFCAERKEIYLRLREQGLHWGVSIIVRSERAVSRIDYYARHLRSTPTPVKLTADLHLLGLYLHEIKRSLIRAEKGAQLPTLTAREKECLCWTAAGKTTHEVGMILGISSHTVSFHLKNVAAKLNVYGTRHTITKAITLGLIQLGSQVTMES